MSEKKIVVKLKYGASASPHHGSSSSPKQLEYAWNYKRIAFAMLSVVGLGLFGYGLLTGLPVPEVSESTGEMDVLSELEISKKPPPVAEVLTNDRQSSSIQPGENPRPEEIPTVTGSEAVDSLTEKIRPGERLVAQQALSEQGGSELTIADAAAFQEVAKIDTPEITENVVRAQFAWGIKEKEPAGEIRSPAILQRGDSVALYFFSELKGMNGQTLTHQWSHNGTVAVSKNFRVDGDRWRVFSSKQLNSDLLGEWKVAIRDSNGNNLGEFVLDVLEPLNRKQ